MVVVGGVVEVEEVMDGVLGEEEMGTGGNPCRWRVGGQGGDVGENVVAAFSVGKVSPSRYFSEWWRGTFVFSYLTDGQGEEDE